MLDESSSKYHPTPKEYLSVLNPEQKLAVEHTGKSLLILAGAGSGKTRVITTKIAYLIAEQNIDPYSILAVTFTKKAAQEMSDRAYFLEPKAIHSYIRTFHSFGAWFLRLYYEKAGLAKNFTVYDEDASAILLQKALPQLSTKEASAWVKKISRAKDYCLLPNSPELVKIDSSIDSNIDFAKVYQIYEDNLRKTGNIDFGDLIMLPVLLLQNNEEIRNHMHRKFRVILVDEYQDSNVAQFLLLQALTGDETYVCVVGDDDQSIYNFRGAEVQNILTFPEHFSQTDLIKLERNYRSTPQILNIANDIISNNKNRFEKQLKAEKKDGEKPAIIFLENQNDETEFCTEIIKRANSQGVPFNDWAILYRTNAQSLGFETTLLHNKIPYRIVGALRFYEREEIKDALAFLAFIANPKDKVAFTRIVNKPARGLGEKTQTKIINYVDENLKNDDDSEVNFISASKKLIPELPSKAKNGLKEFISIIESLTSLLQTEENVDLEIPAKQLAYELFPSEELRNEKKQQIENQKLSYFIEQLNHLSGLTAYYKTQDEISKTQKEANLQELANSAVLYPLNMSGLLDFLDHIELDRNLEEKNTETEDAVTLITVHNTKGLEFPRVIMTGLENGIFPRLDKKDEELEEERRLFYVGVTRAKNQLFMTSCRKRFRFGKTDEMEPSQFLLEINKNRVDYKGSVPAFMKSTKPQQKHPLEATWKKGSRVYHDDYGYGNIIQTRIIDKEFVIYILFETGNEKKFMPEYQKHSLVLLKD